MGVRSEMMGTSSGADNQCALRDRCQDSTILENANIVDLDPRALASKAESHARGDCRRPPALCDAFVGPCPPGSKRSIPHRLNNDRSIRNSSSTLFELCLATDKSCLTGTLCTGASAAMRRYVPPSTGSGSQLYRLPCCLCWEAEYGARRIPVDRRTYHAWVSLIFSQSRSTQYAVHDSVTCPRSAAHSTYCLASAAS